MTAAMVKIRSYKASQSGLRGVKLTLPNAWLRDLALKPGDMLDVYRDTEDRLIIVAAKPAKRKA